MKILLWFFGLTSLATNVAGAEERVRYCYDSPYKAGRVYETTNGGVTTTTKVLSVERTGDVEHIKQEITFKGILETFVHEVIVHHDEKVAFREAFDPGFSVTITTPEPYWKVAESCFELGETKVNEGDMIIPIENMGMSKVFQSTKLRSVEDSDNGIVLVFEDVVHIHTEGIPSMSPAVGESRASAEYGVKIWTEPIAE